MIKHCIMIKLKDNSEKSKKEVKEKLLSLQYIRDELAAMEK